MQHEKPYKSRDCLHRTCSNFQKQLDRQQQNGKEQTGLRDVFFKAEQLDMASVKSKCNISGYILCFSTIHFYSTWSVKVKTKHDTFRVELCTEGRDMGQKHCEVFLEPCQSSCCLLPMKEHHICFQEEQTDPIFMWAPCGERIGADTHCRD